MRDVDMAKEYLEKENLSLAVVKNGKLVFKSDEKGIKPIFTLAVERREDVKGSSLADRVIGKGAAMICKYIGVKEVYGSLISEAAAEVLNMADIKFSYGEICPYIRNRDNTGICPIEKLSLETEDVHELLDKIERFLYPR
jgi:hypothetical protein